MGLATLLGLYSPCYNVSVLQRNDAIEYIPSMAHTDDMVNIAQGELEELVRQYTASVCEAKKTVVCEDGPQAHCSSMQNGLIAQGAKARMAVHYLDLLADNDVAEDWEEGEDGWEACLAIDDEKRDIVDFKAIGQVSHTGSTGVGVCDNDNFVSTIDEFLDFSDRIHGVVWGGRVVLRWTAGTCDFPLLLYSIRCHI